MLFIPETIEFSHSHISIERYRTGAPSCIESHQILIKSPFSHGFPVGFFNSHRLVGIIPPRRKSSWPANLWHPAHGTGSLRCVPASSKTIGENHGKM